VSAVALELPLVWETEEPPAARPGRSGAGAPDSERGAGPAAADPGGEPTLDSLLSGMWEGLAAHRSVPCPLCGAEMTPEYGAHRRPVGGHCRSCDTRFS
jgi:hypothetical protein